MRRVATLVVAERSEVFVSRLSIKVLKRFIFVYLAAIGIFSLKYECSSAAKLLASSSNAAVKLLALLKYWLTVGLALSLE